MDPAEHKFINFEKLSPMQITKEGFVRKAGDGLACNFCSHTWSSRYKSYGGMIRGHLNSKHADAIEIWESNYSDLMQRRAELVKLHDYGDLPMNLIDFANGIVNGTQNGDSNLAENKEKDSVDFSPS